MANYGAFPLRFSGGGFMAGRDELPLSADLVDELSRWGKEYGDTLSANGYAWPGSAERHDWNLRGQVFSEVWFELASTPPGRFSSLTKRLASARSSLQLRLTRSAPTGH